MNKFFIATAFVMALTGSAFALTTQDETHNGKVAAVPGAQHSKGFFAPAVQVTPHGVVVTAPPGADVDVLNDENGLSVDIEPRKPGLFGNKRGLLGIGFLGL
jgi:hypothetical protein